MNLPHRKYLVTLDCLSDGYQNVRSLSGGDLTLSEFNLSKEELFEILQDAVSKGYAKAYRYLVETKEYVETGDFGNDRHSKVWFYITPMGRDFVESNWPES